MPYPVEVLLWVSAGITALWVIVTKGLVPLWKGVVAFVNFAQAAAEFSKALPKIEAIAAEFEPNDGSTLVDKVNLLVVSQGEQTRALETHISDFETEAKRIRIRLSQLEEHHRE